MYVNTEREEASQLMTGELAESTPVVLTAKKSVNQLDPDVPQGIQNQAV